MINLVNERETYYDGSGGLTVDERKSVLQRALNAVPFFNVFPYEIVTEAVKRKQYKGKTYINLDFFLTDIRGNFDKVFQETATEWLVNLYIASTGRSLYGYNKSQPLPTPFVMSDTRGTVAGAVSYDDRQRESIPFLIPKGSEIISQIINVDAKTNAAEAKVMLAGFNTIKYPYLTTDETERINASLADDTIFQTFRFTVDHAGQKFYNLTNDSRPRVVLGFGIVDSSADTGLASISDVSIFDSTRHLRLTNEQIPVEFIAPRLLSNVFDAHIYYLPIEHYFMPFGNLQFQINNAAQAGRELSDYEFIMLTRTV